MRVVEVTKYGPPEVLQVRERLEPVPEANQVVIRVHAAGINFADILMRLGFYTRTPKPPFVPGFEISGVVDAVGIDVPLLRVGDRVMASTFPSGGYAEQVAVPADRVLPLPEKMSFEDAAAIPVNYLTAYQALTYMANLRQGERVLIHAAAGGVGLAAIQLAKFAGAETFGTASASKHDFLRQQGLDHAIDYHSQDFEREVMGLTRGEGVDVVLDAVGGPSYRKSYRLLRHCGRLICFGMSAAVPGKGRSLKALKAWWQTPSFNALDLIGRNRTVSGLHVGELGRANPRLVGSWMPELFRMYEAGQIKPHIGATFPLAEAAAAHHFIHDRKNLGKVLLIP